MQNRAADFMAALDEAYAQGGVEGQLASSNNLAGLKNAANLAIGVGEKMMLTGLTDLSKAGGFNVARACGRVGGAALQGITLATDTAHLIVAYRSHAPGFTKIHGWALVISDMISLSSGLMGPIGVPLRWLGMGMHGWDSFTQDFFDRRYGNK